jgi:hypothetical protein
MNDKIWKLIMDRKACAQCKKLFKPHESVWLGRLDINSYPLIAVCNRCIKKSGLGQKLVNPSLFRYPLDDPLKRYRWRLLAKKRSEERKAKRGQMLCATCNQSFTPKRADAKHCSDKCKQKAYRQRGEKNEL